MSVGVFGDGPDAGVLVVAAGVFLVEPHRGPSDRAAGAEHWNGAATTRARVWWEHR